MIAAAFAVLGGAGCATPPSARDRLINRAAFDLRCAKSALNVMWVERDTPAVNGCGQQATYVYLCDHDNTCRWLLNGGPRSD